MDSNPLRLAHVRDLPEGKSMVVQGPEGLSVALFNLGGQVFALENRCPHMDGPLGEGDVENGIVTCPWHGWQFDITDGACQNMPGEDATKLSIEIVDGYIYLKGG